MTRLDPAKPFNILFLCTGNSARSILAECIMNRVGAGKFIAYSAGSTPKGEVHPQSIKLLQRLGYETGNLRSKSWDEFAKPGAPHLNFVITVCDNAAGEVCPIWPGQPITSHWGLPDPAAVAGSDAAIALAFADTYRMLNNRIGIFASLPIGKLSALALKDKMDDIGALRDADEPAGAGTVTLLHPNGPGSEQRFSTFIAWLEAADLPVDDLADDQPRYYMLAGPDHAPLAFAGLVGTGPDLLLRSLIVDPARRENGAGSLLVQALARIAKTEGTERIWSLTTNADAWFLAAGWRRAERSDAPEAIKRTRQFAQVCPASAALLVHDLT